MFVHHYNMTNLLLRYHRHRHRPWSNVLQNNAMSKMSGAWGGSEKKKKKTIAKSLKRD
jgi:hypothetical protein